MIRSPNHWIFLGWLTFYGVMGFYKNSNSDPCYLQLDGSTQACHLISISLNIDEENWVRFNPGNLTCAVCLNSGTEIEGSFDQIFEDDSFGKGIWLEVYIPTCLQSVTIKFTYGKKFLGSGTLTMDAQTSEFDVDDYFADLGSDAINQALSTAFNKKPVFHRFSFLEPDSDDSEDED